MLPVGCSTWPAASGPSSRWWRCSGGAIATAVAGAAAIVPSYGIAAITTTVGIALLAGFAEEPGWHGIASDAWQRIDAVNASIVRRRPPGLARTWAHAAVVWARADPTEPAPLGAPRCFSVDAFEHTALCGIRQGIARGWRESRPKRPEPAADLRKTWSEPRRWRPLARRRRTRQQRRRGQGPHGGPIARRARAIQGATCPEPTQRNRRPCGRLPLPANPQRTALCGIRQGLARGRRECRPKPPETAGSRRFSGAEPPVSVPRPADEIASRPAVVAGGGR